MALPCTGSREVWNSKWASASLSLESSCCGPAVQSELARCMRLQVDGAKDSGTARRRSCTESSGCAKNSQRRKQEQREGAPFRRMSLSLYSHAVPRFALKFATLSEAILQRFQSRVPEWSSREKHTHHKFIACESCWDVGILLCAHVVILTSLILFFLTGKLWRWSTIYMYFL